MITVRGMTFETERAAIDYFIARVNRLDEKIHELLHDMVLLDENPQEAKNIATKWIEITADEIAEVPQR